MVIDYEERRMFPRIEIGGDMSYKTSGSSQVHEGLLENLSSEGARIWIDQELPAASQLMIRMVSDSQEEDSMTFMATLLYKLPQQKLSQHGYGCRIETSAGW